MPDHLHVLASYPATEAIADVVRDLKANASRWLRSEFSLDDFAWQQGYSAFSIGRTERLQVAHYIAMQQQHHREQIYQEELLKLLHDYDVEYDPRYLWD